MAAGLYIHFPFCERKCDYCAFCSRRPVDGEIERYISALEKEAERLGDNYKGVDFDTVYIGGGTPSLMTAKELSLLADAVLPYFDIAKDIEFTTEANPESFSKGFAFAFSEIGGNRLSLGVQSLVAEECAAVGRKTEPEKVFRAIDTAKEAGITNISCDLLSGLPFQTEASLTENIKRLSAAGITHLSLYSLNVEEGTPLYKRKDALSFPDDEKEFSLYLAACELLSSLGFEHYEVSNFAKAGFRSRHNLKYWRGDGYLGIGPAAHSYMDGKRFYYPKDIDGFIAGGAPVSEEDGEIKTGSLEERIMLSLRTADGLPLSLIPEEKRPAAKAFTAKLTENGLAKPSDSFVILTDRGLFVMNEIILKLTDIINN